MPKINKIQEKLVKALEHHKVQNFDQAEKLYREVLDAVPDFDIALQFYGTLLFQKCRYDEALEYLHKSARIAPSADIYTTLGEIYTIKNENTNAIEYYLKALELSPASPELNYKVGISFYQIGNIKKAVEHFNLVLQYAPDHADTYYMLGMILHNNNQIKPAINYYKKALELNLINDSIYFNLGSALCNENLYDESINYYEKALELNPNNPDTYNNIGSSYQAKNNLEKAIHYYNKAIEKAPKDLYYYNLGRALLLTENFEKGWEYFESRMNLFDWHKPKLDTQKCPLWIGQPLKDKTIYVYSAGGNGDSIQFARYLPVLHSMGAKIVCCPQNGLIELFKQSDLGAEIISFDDLPVDAKFDYQLPFFSCGNAFKANPENIPYKEGYLKANPEKVKYYKENYFNNDKLKIGLYWQGSDQPWDVRPIPLSCLYKLKNLKNIELYSLQKGFGTEQLDSMSDDFRITRLGETFENYLDTAAAIENLDLVITIDTSIVHLSGALGKKTWGLFSFSPDWRWLMDRADCIWYSSVKVMRQKDFGNWTELSDRLYDELKDMIDKSYTC